MSPKTSCFSLLMSLSFLICIAGTGPSERPRELLDGPSRPGEIRDLAGEEGGSRGEGAGPGSGRSRGSTNQERHWGGASFGLRFYGYSWWQCRSKQRPGQGAEIVAGAGRPLEGRTELGSPGPGCPSAHSSSVLESAGGGWLQVLTPF